MTRVQRTVDRLNEQLAGAVDHTLLASIGAELAAAQAELAVLEERWLELAERQSS